MTSTHNSSVKRVTIKKQERYQSRHYNNFQTQAQEDQKANLSFQTGLQPDSEM